MAEGNLHLEIVEPPVAVHKFRYEQGAFLHGINSTKNKKSFVKIRLSGISSNHKWIHVFACTVNSNGYPHPFKFCGENCTSRGFFCKKYDYNDLKEQTQNGSLGISLENLNILRIRRSCIEDAMSERETSGLDLFNKGYNFDYTNNGNELKKVFIAFSCQYSTMLDEEIFVCAPIMTTKIMSDTCAETLQIEDYQPKIFKFDTKTLIWVYVKNKFQVKCKSSVFIEFSLSEDMFTSILTVPCKTLHKYLLQFNTVDMSGLLSGERIVVYFRYKIISADDDELISSVGNLLATSNCPVCKSSNDRKFVKAKRRQTDSSNMNGVYSTGFATDIMHFNQSGENNLSLFAAGGDCVLANQSQDGMKLFASSDSSSALTKLSNHDQLTTSASSQSVISTNLSTLPMSLRTPAVSTTTTFGDESWWDDLFELIDPDFFFNLFEDEEDNR